MYSPVLNELDYMDETEATLSRCKIWGDILSEMRAISHDFALLAMTFAGRAVFS